MEATIKTFTGKKYNPIFPNPKDICIEDIAHSLSNQCRFTGHTKFFYSTAEHSIRGSIYAPEGLKLAFLLHDAGEAYLSDIARPVKHQKEFKFYREIENRNQYAIETAFNLPHGILESPQIKEIDKRMLHTEARDLMDVYNDWNNNPFDFHIENSYTPELAKMKFLMHFNDYVNKGKEKGQLF